MTRLVGYMPRAGDIQRPPFSYTGVSDAFISPSVAESVRSSYQVGWVSAPSIDVEKQVVRAAMAYADDEEIDMLLEMNRKVNRAFLKARKNNQVGKMRKLVALHVSVVNKLARAVRKKAAEEAGAMSYQTKFSKIALPKLMAYELKLLGYGKSYAQVYSYQFANPFAGIIQGVGGAFQGAQRWFTNTITPSLTTAATVLQRGGQAILVGGQQIIQTAQTVAGNIQKSVVQAGGVIAERAKVLWNQAASAAQAGWNRFTEEMGKFGAAVSKTIGQIGNAAAATVKAIGALNGLINKAANIANRVDRMAQRAKPRTIPQKMLFAIDRELYILTFQAKRANKQAIAGRLAEIRTKRAQAAQRLTEIAANKKQVALAAGGIGTTARAIISGAQAKLSKVRGKAAEVESGRKRLLQAEREAQIEGTRLRRDLQTKLSQTGATAMNVTGSIRAAPRGVQRRMGYDKAAFDEYEGAVMSFRHDVLSYSPIIPIVMILAIGSIAVTIAVFIAQEVMKWSAEQEAIAAEKEARLTDLESQVTILTQNEDVLVQEIGRLDTQIVDLQNQLVTEVPDIGPQPGDEQYREDVPVIFTDPTIPPQYPTTYYPPAEIPGYTPTIPPYQMAPPYIPAGPATQETPYYPYYSPTQQPYVAPSQVIPAEVGPGQLIVGPPGVSAGPIGPLTVTPEGVIQRVAALPPAMVRPAEVEVEGVEEAEAEEEVEEVLEGEEEEEVEETIDESDILSFDSLF